jgi:hypothetical protein
LQVAFDGMQIGVAESAAANADTDFSGTGSWRGEFFQTERGIKD